MYYWSHARYSIIRAFGEVSRSMHNMGPERKLSKFWCWCFTSTTHNANFGMAFCPRITLMHKSLFRTRFGIFRKSCAWRSKFSFSRALALTTTFIVSVPERTKKRPFHEVVVHLIECICDILCTCTCLNTPSEHPQPYGLPSKEILCGILLYISQDIRSENTFSRIACSRLIMRNQVSG